MNINISKRDNCVDIEIHHDGNVYIISGHIFKNHDGRCEFENFEPFWFADSQSEEFYDANWEVIEKTIIN